MCCVCGCILCDADANNAAVVKQWQCLYKCAFVWILQLLPSWQFSSRNNMRD